MTGRASLGLPTPDGYNAIAADANSDGEVSFSDAVSIARFVIGMGPTPSSCVGEPRLQ